jgi:hypothetical protein
MGTALDSNALEFKGKVGNIISYYSRGKLCFRAKPSHYKDRKSKTQVKQRNRLTICTQFAVNVIDSLNKKVLKRGNKGWTYLQHFNHLNMPAFNKKGEIEHYELLKFSCNLLLLPPELKISIDPSSTQTISVIWEMNRAEEETNPNDRLRVIVINNKNKSYIPELSSTRKDEGATFQLPSKNWNKLHLYAFFYNKSTFISSPTYYQMIQRPVS